MFLVTTLVILFSCPQDYAITAQNPTEAQGKGQTSLVPFYKRLEAVDNSAAVSNSNHSTVPSFEGQAVPCSHHKQDDFKGSMEMQSVPTTTSQQTQSTLLWGMWNEVAAVHRLHLRAQCTTSSTAALPGPFCSFMDMAIEHWRSYTPRCKTQEFQCSSPASQENQRQISRQGQRGWKRQAKRESKRHSPSTTWTSSTTSSRTTALDGSTAIDASATGSSSSSQSSGRATAAIFGSPTEKEPRSTSSRSTTPCSRGGSGRWTHLDQGHALCSDSVWQSSSRIQLLHQSTDHALSILAAILGWFHRTVEDLHIELPGTDQDHFRENCGSTSSHEGSRTSLGPHQGEHGRACGIRLRDGRRGHGQLGRTNPRRLDRDGQLLGRAPQDCRGDCHTRLRTGCKKSQEGERARNRKRGWATQTWLCIHAAFWAGPLSTTEVCLDAARGASSTLLHDLTLKWNHSVCSRKDFVSDWEACTKAFHLAAEFDYTRVHRGAQHNYTSLRKTDSSKGLECHVRFAREIEILIGIEEQITMSSIMVPETTLTWWHQKPWSLHQNFDATEPPRDEEADDFSLMQSNRGWTTDDRESLQQSLFTALQSGGLQDCPDAVQQMVQQMMDPPSSSSNSTTHGPQQTAIPEALQNLQAYWQASAAQPDQQHRYLNTWYLNHEDHLVCDRSRQVRLHADPTHWARQIVQRWSDRVVMIASYQFFLVRPHPPASAHEQFQHPHLILQQLPQPGRRSILISASMVTRHPGQYAHWATTMPAAARKQDLIQEVRATWECEPPDDDRRCQIWRGNQLYAHNDVLQLAPGDSVVFIAQDIGAHGLIPAPAGQEDDAVWLTQVSSHQTKPIQEDNDGFRIDILNTSWTPLASRSQDVLDYESQFAQTHDNDDLSMMAMQHQPGLPDTQPIMDRLDIAVEPQALVPQEPIDTPDSDPEEEPDVIHLDTYLVQIFPLGAPPVRGRLPIHAPNIFIPQAANLLGVDVNSLLICHVVQVAPQDLQRSHIIPYIAQENGQLLNGDPLSYALMDVEFHHHMPYVTPQTMRTAKLLPRRITREHLLKIVGVKRYCEDVANAPLFDASQCLVWVDGHLLGMDPPRAIDIDHGAYIRVMIPPHPDRQNSVTTREMAELCFHHLEALAPLGDEAFNHLPETAVQLPHDIDIVVSIPDSDQELEAVELLQLISLPASPQTCIDDLPIDDLGLDQVAQCDNQSGGQSKTRQPLTDITNCYIRSPHLGTDHTDNKQSISLPSTSDRSPSLPKNNLEEYALPRFERELRQHLCSRNGPELLQLEFAFKVTTWYVDQQRIPVQTDHREVWLQNQPLTWQQDILQAWQDLVLADQPAHFFVANPQPRPTMLEEEALHVLIVQTPIPGLASFLIQVRVEDNDHTLDILKAETASRVAGHEMIFQIARVGHYCSLTQDDHLCTISIADQELPDNRPIIIEDAMTIKATVHNSLTVDSPVFDDVRRLLPPDEHADDSVHLLQKFQQTISQACGLRCPFLDPPPVMDMAQEGLGHSEEPTRLPHTDKQAGNKDGGSSWTSAPVILSLDACLRPTHKRPIWKAEDPAYLLFEQADWFQHVRQGRGLHFAPLPEGLRMPKSSYRAFMTMEDFDWDLPVTWETYVDGSTSMTGAAWAAILVVYNGHQRAFAGCLHGVVVTNPRDPAWLGAITLDNIAAELNAMIIALLAIHRCPGYRHSVRPDLSLSHLLAHAQCTTTSNPIMAKMVAILGSWLEPTTTIDEIRGHTSDPWNDLADALAKHTVQHGIQSETVDVGALHAMASSVTDLGWAWLQDEPLLQQSFPPLFDGQVVQVGPSFRRAQLPEKITQPSQPLKISGKIVTANVLSLETARTQRQVGRLGGHRTVRLASQWHKDKIHVVGVQEARTPAGRLLTDHYLILSSGCDTSSTAQHGCELWIHRKLSFFSAPGLDFCLADGKIVIQHADPRRLCVRVATPAADISFIVLHAPCLRHLNNGTRPIEAVREWWEETVNILRKFPTDDLTFVMIDANAPLASKTTDLFSSHDAEPTNEVGSIFEAFLEDMDFLAPSTFGFWHTGPSTTWTHSSGQRLRRDYVLAKRASMPHIQFSAVCTDHDGLFDHEDHLPCLLALDGWHNGSLPKNHAGWDYEAFLDPRRVARYQQALESLPVPSWDIAVDDHCAVLEAQLLELGQQFFGRRKKGRTRPKLTEPTLALIAAKRQFLDLGRKTGEIFDTEFKQELLLFDKMVKKAVAVDVQAHYDNLLNNLENAHCLSNSKLVFQILTRLGGKKKTTKPLLRPLPLLRDESGQPYLTFEAQQRMWLQKFGEMEAGTMMTLDNIKMLNRPGVSANPEQIDMELLPDLWTVQRAVKAVKPGKTAGPDGIPSDLARIGGRPLSIHLAALYAKSSLRKKEPIQWKGGRLHPLWKGRKDPRDPAAYRSIYISNFLGKIYHQILRQPVLQAWSPDTCALQLGGRKKLGTDIAHHFLQLHQHWARQQGLPSGIIFFDVQAAFYTLLRQTIIESESQDRAIAYVLHQTGFADDQIQDTIDRAAAHPATADLSQHLQALLRDLLSNTYFTLEGVSHCCLTTRGTRPGDPIADLLYNVVMTSILLDYRREALNRLEPLGYTWCGHPEPQQSFDTSDTLPARAFFDLSFVDDTAILFHSDHNEDIPQLITHLVDAMITAVGRRGLHLSLEDGKTEVLWNIRGRGSRKVKQQMSQQRNRIQWQHAGQALSVQLVANYKHLGTNVQKGHSHAQEISFRGRSAKSQFGILARPFYKKHAVGTANKVKIFRALSMSRLLYNAHIWCGVTDKEWQRWANHIRAPIAMLLKGKIPEALKFEFSTETLCSAVGLLPPHDCVHVARLNYLKRLTQICPRSLWTLILHEERWTEACLDSLAWLSQHYPYSLPANLEDSFVQWLLVIALDNGWKGRVKTAAKACLTFRQLQAEDLIWTKTFELHFREIAGLPPQPGTSTAGHWICDLCSTGFISRRALAMHASKVHGYKTMTKYFATGDVCNHCLRWFHNRKRLQIHLTTQTECLRVLQSCYPPMPEDEVQRLDDHDAALHSQLKLAGWRPTTALEPMIQLQGPALPPAGTDDAALLYAKQVARSGPGGTSFELLQGHNTAPQDEIDPASREPNPGQPAFILQSACGQHAASGQLGVTDLAYMYAQLHIRHQVFVHFYSGYRRKADLHQVLQETTLRNGTVLMVISVDICLQRQSGDLARDGAVRWWKDRVDAGQLIGYGGGPPCESYTAARYLEGGPRALRDATYPSGLPARTATEFAQVRLGTRLVQFLFELILYGAPRGCCAFAEHPQYPIWARAHNPVSIWSTKAARLLKSLQCTSVVSFDQCVFKSESRKPTTLLLVRMAGVRDLILAQGHAGRCCHGRTFHAPLKGKTEQGLFCTAKAKIYPAGLNRAIARGVIDHANKVNADGKCRDFPPQELDHLILNIFADDDVVQPDCHLGK